MICANFTFRLHIFLFSALLLIGSSLQAQNKLISFELKDQFDTTYTHQDFDDQVLIAVLSDKKGSDYNERWSLAILDSLGEDSDEVRFLPVADMRKVPFFVRGLVKKFFPKDPEVWILLDWKGQFAKTYEQVEKSCNIILFDRNSEVVYQTAVTEIDETELSTIVDHLRLLTKSPERLGSATD
ncbi:MAG: hypothetical protein AAFP70_13095 [Calditrichota bacterium]